MTCHAVHDDPMILNTIYGENTNTDFFELFAVITKAGKQDKQTQKPYLLSIPFFDWSHFSMYWLKKNHKRIISPSGASVHMKEQQQQQQQHRCESA